MGKWGGKQKHFPATSPLSSVVRALVLCTRSHGFEPRMGQFGPGTISHGLSKQVRLLSKAAIAQLGERQTEDLEVPGSIPGFGNFRLLKKAICPFPNNGGKVK